ncbi:unnamed protein product [Clavelina lepadiformis]|uniref:Uncharacterized protein n=1 Tax=Clavelina lepadiformis TaxID=159417 RepID=A0ABP0F9F4_CLALP
MGSLSHYSLYPFSQKSLEPSQPKQAFSKLNELRKSKPTNGVPPRLPTPMSGIRRIQPNSDPQRHLTILLANRFLSNGINSLIFTRLLPDVLSMSFVFTNCLPKLCRILPNQTNHLPKAPQMRLPDAPCFSYEITKKIILTYHHQSTSTILFCRSFTD